MLIRLILGTFLIVVLGPLAASADTALQVQKPWSRATPPGAMSGVVYMMIENKGNEADTLKSVSTPLSSSTMIHETIMKEGVMTMNHRMALPIPAGGSVQLEPGGLHLMLMGLSQPLKAGTTLPLTLTFEKSGPITLNVPILPPGKTP